MLVLLTVQTWYSGQHACTECSRHAGHVCSILCTQADHCKLMQAVNRQEQG